MQFNWHERCNTSGHQEVTLKRTIHATFYLIAAVLSVLPLSAQQPASTVSAPPSAAPTLFNKDLPAWVRFTGEYRARLEGVDGLSFKPDMDDAFYLSRLRLNLNVSPASWMRFQFQVQDAEVVF